MMRSNPRKRTMPRKRFRNSTNRDETVRYAFHYPLSFDFDVSDLCPRTVFCQPFSNRGHLSICDALRLAVTINRTNVTPRGLSLMRFMQHPTHESLCKLGNYSEMDFHESWSRCCFRKKSYRIGASCDQRSQRSLRSRSDETNKRPRQVSN